MEKKKICSCCRRKEVGKNLWMLCDSCYKLNGQKRRGFSTGNCIPEDEFGHGAFMTDWGQR